ncbi:dynamin family protein [Leucothrix arctica]|uniref:Dynamin family protein n=1 Tax=Leucothrix arctica TaxID=1481894 RepID=A0A317CQU1_9GAMM|nr:dynamin family protein [Leucothrix arctica]PWQ98780.1 dynamin family protein [Leucothrix arctica]
MTPAQRMKQRLESLQTHLKKENPVLVAVVDRYKKLDAVALKMGLLKPGESYATQISWWPLISVLGTFSAGKSSFINSYTGMKLQDTGNQAVDDRFTVISYSSDDKSRTLPGIALDGDPRFPFYQISEEIEQVTEGEGAKIDNYLQMKVVPSEALRGKILIDSPGFDADEQRKSTLKLTDHIIDLSDLVLVFFDARHPEPGAMQDTLEHLVKGAQRRNDSSKFLFILNQIDTSAKEDNLESIVASWHKALVQCGLSTGRFYVMFNKDLAVPVEDEGVWNRYVSKRDTDYAAITARMEEINVERVYRLIGNLETLSNQIEQQAVPLVSVARDSWRKRVFFFDAIALGSVTLGLGALAWTTGWLPQWLTNPLSLLTDFFSLGLLVAFLLLLLFIHFVIRGWAAKGVAKKLSNEAVYGDVSNAFMKSTRPWTSVLKSGPVGWSKRVSGKLFAIRNDVDQFVQKLNDNFSRPDGDNS